MTRPPLKKVPSKRSPLCQKEPRATVVFLDRREAGYGQLRLQAGRQPCHGSSAWYFEHLVADGPHLELSELLYFRRVDRALTTRFATGQESLSEMFLRIRDRGCGGPPQRGRQRRDRRLHGTHNKMKQALNERAIMRVSALVTPEK